MCSKNGPQAVSMEDSTSCVTSALFVGSIYTPWALVWGAVPLALALTAWFWPTRPRRTETPA